MFQPPTRPNHSSPMPRMTLDNPADRDPHERALRVPRGLWRHLSKTPWATALWLFVIVWCIGTMPSTTTAWPAGAPRLPGGIDDVPRASLVRRSGVIVAIDPATEKPSDNVIGAAWYDYRLRPDFEQKCVTITGTAVAPGDLPAARAAYVAYLGTLTNPYWSATAAKLAGGNRTDTLRFHGRRIAQTSLAIAAFFLLFRSLAWTAPILLRLFDVLGRVTPDPVERERRRRLRRLAAGNCPECGYCILTLPQRKCPECGHTWTEEEQRAASA